MMERRPLFRRFRFSTLGISNSAAFRVRLAQLTAIATLVSVAVVFYLSDGIRFLMPGPLSGAHSTIANCNACHSRSGGGKFSWVRGLVADNHLTDRNACLVCHKTENAFNGHGASADTLKQSTERLLKVASKTPEPLAARLQSVVPTIGNKAAQNISCATCHQEHRGVAFDLKKISNEQCRACHVVKFDSFEGHHPDFEHYPFKRRTEIIYDHAGHFDKYFPETAKKDPVKRIPATCSACHDSGEDKRIIAIKSFDQICSSCHLDQITGKDRASGPKGIAFLSVPGLDLQTLRKRNAAIGEWPEASEAQLTPFMKVMISRSEPGRAAIKDLQGLNLQDLATASDAQIKAVTTVAVEIKKLFYALISGKASDAFGGLNIAAGAKPSPGLVADLTAGIPRTVIVSAQEQWLPNLATEMVSGVGTSAQAPSAPGDTKPSSTGPEASDAIHVAPGAEKQSRSASTDSDPPSHPEEKQKDKEGEATKHDPPPSCLVRVLGQCLLTTDDDAQQSESKSKSGKTAGNEDKANTGSDGKKSPSKDLPGAMRAGLSDVKVSTADDVTAQTNKKAALSDDLLHPTDEERREIEAATRGSRDGGMPANSAEPAGSDRSTGQPGGARLAAPVVSIESKVDPETWAEYGGWYSQDYAIFYRPIGHKDKFVYSWLFLTGPQARKDETSSVGTVFDSLTGKDAQGSCTKCHSVDDLPNHGRVVNFAPASGDGKEGRFTTFKHQPHFGIVGDRGCLTCHKLENGGGYLKGYEQRNPKIFQSNFRAVDKGVCQTCHNSKAALQECTTCHQYHVNGVTTPIITTKLPTQ